MSQIKRFNFDDATDWTFDSSKVEFTSSLAKLVLQDNPNQHFTQDFSSDTGFTYDSSEVEFVAGLVQQKDQRAADTIFGAQLSSSEDGNWGEGDLTGVLGGGAVISGGYLDVTSSGADRWRNTDNTNSNLLQEGTIKFIFVPNFTGAPASFKYLFSCGDQVGSPRIYSYINADGSIAVRGTGDSDAVIFNMLSSALTWTSGQEYEISLDFDVTNGTTNLFIDGVSVTSSSSTGTRTTAPNAIVLGNLGSSGTSGISGKFKDLLIFDTIQHTSNYTPGYSVPEYIYAGSTVVLPPFSYTGIGSIQAVESSSIVETGAPRFIIATLYWNGSAWVPSDGSYSQANDSATAIANLTSLNVSGATVVPVSIVFTDAHTQSNVDYLDVAVTGQIYPTTDQAIESVSTILSDSYILFEESTVKPANTNVTWVLKLKDNSYVYYNGSAWVTSNLTEAQANTVAEINANKASIIGAGETYENVKMVAILSSDGTATPEASWVQITYSFYSLEPVTPINTTTLYFYIHDLLNIDFSEATFFASSKKSFFHTERLIVPIEQSSEANVDGYVELDIIETETVNKKLNFKLEYVDPNDNVTKTVNFKSAIIPDQVLTKGSEILTPK